MENKTKGCTPRVAKLINDTYVMPEVDTERLKSYTASYRQTEGEWPCMRQAKAFSETLQNITVKIWPGELIVGCATCKRRGGAVLPELNAKWLTKEIDDMSVRNWDRFCKPTEDERREIMDLIPLWKGRSAYDIWQKRLPGPLEEMLAAGFIGGVTFSNNGFYPAHVAVDFEMVLCKGLQERYSTAKIKRAELDLSDVKNIEKYYYYTSMMISLEAVKEFSARYSELAMRMAAKEQDAARKAELEEIAEICAHVPWEPAKSFREAVQAVNMVWTALMLEGWGHGMSLGRMDQYLLRYYEKDIDSGVISRDEAVELIELLFVKVNSTVTLDDYATATCFAGFPQAVNITIGGVRADGSDAVNDLTYLIMEAERDVAMTAEDLVIRVAECNPRKYLLTAAELAKELKGKLKFVSDPTAIKQLEYDGYPTELARDYIITGCNSPTIPGVSQDVPGGLFNLALMLELALNDGKSRISGRQIGPHTGNPRNFKSYSDVLEAFKEQTEYFMKAAFSMTDLDREVFAEVLPIPLQSALFRGPMERGRDIFSGGTGKYARQSISLAGAPNAGDGLAAIKKVVFEDKTVDISQVIDALDADFVGYENVRNILEKAPKFGNGDRYVDSIVNDILVFGSDLMQKHIGFCGRPFIAAAATISSNVPLGLGVGALPGGRRAKTPIAEGGISPHQGRNTAGPTATMLSVASLSHEKLRNGSVLNMRFDPETLKTEDHMNKFADMLLTYLMNGGFFVQFNIVDTETLRLAQEDPEKYKDLLVRVATYSAYFVELSPEMQEDIISRMEFGAL